MFYRRKVILALPEAIGEPPLSDVDFQRQLFLFTAQQEEPAYELIPHRTGPHSFSAEADRRPMIAKGLLRDGDPWEKATKVNFAEQIRAQFRPESIPSLMTSGYEGVSPETYLNTLTRNGVQILIDVRANPQSRKFGFSNDGLVSEHVILSGAE